MSHETGHAAGVGNLAGLERIWKEAMYQCDLEAAVGGLRGREGQEQVVCCIDYLVAQSNSASQCC